MTEIERATYRNQNVHWVRAFELKAKSLSIELHPYNQPRNIVQLSFDDPDIQCIDRSYADEACEFPWDIIGFDSQQLWKGFWLFCLHTDRCEYVFKSKWPRITFRSE